EESYEVVIAKRLSQLLDTRWQQVELGLYNKYIPEWVFLYGISTHAHGMYHIEFYHHIRSLLAEQCRGQPTFLSGIFGDVWAGNVAVQEINSYRDLRKLGYTHGMDFYKLAERIGTGENAAEAFFYEYEEKLKDHRWQPLITIRTKIILISYLMNVPDYFGFPSWTPFLNFHVATSMLRLPQARRAKRRWQKEFFIRNGVDLDDCIEQSDVTNILNQISMCRHVPELLDESVPVPFLGKDDTSAINQGISRYAAAGSLKDGRENQRVLDSYIKLLVMKPLEELMKRSTMSYHNEDAQILNRRGETLFEEGKFDGAMEAFKKAVELCPGYSEAINNLGVLLFQQGRISEAVSHFRGALAINPDDEIACKNYAEALRAAEGPGDGDVEKRNISVPVTPQGEIATAKDHHERDREEPAGKEFYGENAEYFEWQKEIGEFGGKANLFKFADHIKPEDSVIDFGCGGGYLLKNLKCTEKMGIEINAFARKEAEDLGITVVKSIETIPDHYADRIISNHALEHVEDPLGILKALKNKLKIHGKMVFVVPHQGVREGYHPDDVNNHLYTWNEQTLGNLFAHAGYDVESVDLIQHQWPPDYFKLYTEQGEDVFHKICREYAKRNENYQVRIVAAPPKRASSGASLAQSSARKDTAPVVLVTYNRPRHTRQVLDALKGEGRKRNLYIFSDGPKTEADISAVEETRSLFKRIDWCEVELVEREENIGLAQSIVGAVDHVLDKCESVIVLEDDCVPQKYFFEFIDTCLAKYKEKEKIFGVSGHTVSIPESALRNYPYDLYFSPRIGSWGWATWKRAWNRFEYDLADAYRKINEGNIDICQGGSDIPVMIRNKMTGVLKDVWTLNWVLTVYLNHGCYVYPTTSHIANIGCDGSGAHCVLGQAPGAVGQERKPLVFPSDVIMNEHIYYSFRSHFDIPGRGKTQMGLPESVKLPLESLDKSLFQVEEGIRELNVKNNIGALKIFDTVLRENHGMPCVNYGKAIANVRLGKIDDAVEDLRRLLQAMPEHKKGRKLLNELMKDTSCEMFLCGSAKQESVVCNQE
ncbi:MAG: tetratricopeptide repeat protein, partial [Deltaproteobacteria bacterium]|nr:tetratricopeptide repeat protein [Deltaproteobacteria bacterium]